MRTFASVDDVDDNHVIFEGLAMISTHAFDFACLTRTIAGSICNRLVCYAGFVYDMTDFQHPGGDVVNLFGGCDVSVAYRMIHAFHDSSGKRLKKSLKLIGAHFEFVNTLSPLSVNC